MEIRNLSHQLSAPTLGTGSLVDAINALIEMVSGATTIVFEFDHTRYHVQLIMSHKIALYRILQEQINNIMKHAEATKVWISLYQRGHNVNLVIKDNGKGFNNKRKTNGLGLNNISSRVKILEGTIYLKTAPQKVVCYMSRFPLLLLWKLPANSMYILDDASNEL
jgi:signal transduction histidine kinase